MTTLHQKKPLFALTLCSRPTPRRLDWLVKKGSQIVGFQSESQVAVMPPSGGEMLKGRFLAYLQVGKTQPKPSKKCSRWGIHAGDDAARLPLSRQRRDLHPHMVRLPHHRKLPLNNFRKLISYMCLFCKCTKRLLLGHLSWLPQLLALLTLSTSM